MNRALRVFTLALSTIVVSFPARGPVHGDDVMRAVFPATPPPIKEGTARPRELIVQFRPTADESTEERALREVRAVAARRGLRHGNYLVTLDDDAAVSAALDRLARMAEVDYVERNGLLRMSQARTLQPNDQFFR